MFTEQLSVTVGGVHVTFVPQTPADALALILIVAKLESFEQGATPTKVYVNVEVVAPGAGV